MQQKYYHRLRDERITIFRADPSSPSAFKRRKELFRLSERLGPIVYLMDGGAEYLFFAKSSLQNQPVGYAALTMSEPGDYGLSALVHPFSRKKGIATNLVKFAVDFAKEEKDINRLYAKFIEGTPSERIIHKTDFRYLRRYLRPTGLYHNTYIMDVRNTRI